MTNDGPSTHGGSQFAAVFPSIMLPMFLAVVDQTIVAAALPAIAGSLGGVERVSWVVVGYLVATTIAAPVYGRLRDTHGSRPMMFIALAIFIASSILCALATTIELLTVARLLQGLGGGGLMTISQAMIGETVPPLERARYQGYLAAVAVTSSTFGPVAGGFLTEHVGWRSVFLVNVPIGMLAVLLTARMKPALVTAEASPFDMRGLAYFTAFIVPVLLAVEQAQQMSVSALISFLILVGIAGAALVQLIRHERRFRHPLLQLDLLQKPAIWRSDAMAACHGAALVSLVAYLPIYLHVSHGTSAADAGILMLPLMIGIGFGSMLTGWLVSRTGWAMIVPAYGLIPVVLLLLGLALGLDRLGTRPLLLLLLLIGLFMGTVMAVVQVTVQRAAGVALLGAAAASIQFSRSVGAAIGTALVGAVLFSALALAEPEAAHNFTRIIEQGPGALSSLPANRQTVIQAAIVHSFSAAFLTIAIFAAGALALAWSHPEQRM